MLRIRYMMKKVSLKLTIWIKMVKKLKECMRANKALNQQIRKYNKDFTKNVK